MSAGLVAFLVILALIVAAVILFRSMTKHMRRVPDRFEQPEAADEAQSSGRG